MLTILEAQFDSLADYSLTGYVERVASDLKKRFPTEVAARCPEFSDLAELVREGVARARRYHVVLETDVVRYIECMLLLGHEFESNQDYPWAGPTLFRSDLDGTAKMDHIDGCRIFCLSRPV